MDTKRERAARKAEKDAAGWGKLAVNALSRVQRGKAFPSDVQQATLCAKYAASYGREALSLRDGTVWTGDCE